MSDEPITNPQAEEWLRRAAGKWRLQVLQRRGRNVPSGGDHGWTRHQLPIRLRRFLNGTPVGMVHDVLALLDSETDLEDPLFNWEPAGTLKPERYKPVRTYIVKDGNPNESNGKDPTYTIVQDLRLAEDEGDSLPGVPSGDSCSQQEETDYFWDSPDVSVPADLVAGQGVSYRVTNVSRDPETDLFSYQLQRQVAVTQHTPPHVTECTGYETVYSESWDNLYGNTGSLEGRFYDNSASRTGNVPGDMAEVVLPEPCSQPDGTTVRVQVQESPDCTFRVTVETRVAKTDVLRQSETRKTLRGVTESETVVATSPAPETGLGLGEQVRNELRPDGLYDVTHVTVSKETVGDVGSSCETTVFEHRHDDMRNEAVRPDEEAGPAGGGKTYRVQSRATEEGTWDVTRSETTELESRNAQVRKRKSLRGVTETVVHRNVEDGSVAVANIGDEVQVERTPGGLYNRTETKVTKEDVGDVGSRCQKTIFEHEHSELRNEAARPEAEAGSAGGGVVREVSSRATDEGTWDVTRRTVVEQNVKSARVVRQKTLRGVTETVVERNAADGSVSVARIGDRVEVEKTPGGLYNRTVTSVSAESVGAIGSQCQKTVFQHEHSSVTNVASDPGGHVRDAGGGVTYERSSRATDEGTWDVTERTVAELPVDDAQRSVHKTLRGVTETVVRRNVEDGSLPETLALGQRVQVEKTPGGLYNRVETAVSSEPVGRVASSDAPSVFREVTELTENVPDVTPDDLAGSFVCGGGALVSKFARATEEGTWDLTTRTDSPTARSWTDPDVDTNYLFTRTYRFRNFTDSQMRSLSRDVNSFVDWKLSKWHEESRDPSSHSVDTSSELEDNGLFRGTVSARFSWSTDTAGQRGDLPGDEGYITGKFVWKTFKVLNRYLTSAGFGPAHTYDFHPNDWFYVMIETHIRLAGYGRKALDRLLHADTTYYVVSSVQFNYDESTGKWRYEAVIEQHESTEYDSDPGVSDKRIYAHDINKSYGIPGDRASAILKKDTSLSSNASTFISTFVDPYIVEDSGRMDPPGSDPGEPAPEAMYPESCEGGQ